MGLASYEIIGTDAEWRVHHDGKAENVYETKEPAFEAAVAAASLAAAPRGPHFCAGPWTGQRLEAVSLGEWGGIRQRGASAIKGAG
jgi:hypothetical protein